LETLGLSPVWLNVMGQYQLIQEIGQGSFGSVIKANCKSSGQDVAIKLIKDF
jgi:serine/threonine protein kinase